MLFASQPVKGSPDACIASALSNAWLIQPSRRPTTSTTDRFSRLTKSSVCNPIGQRHPPAAYAFDDDPVGARCQFGKCCEYPVRVDFDTLLARCYMGRNWLSERVGVNLLIRRRTA